MPSLTTRDFGVSLGGFRPIETQTLHISLRHGGIDRAQAATQIEEGGTFHTSDVRFIRGGVASDYAYTNFDAAYAGADKPIVQIAPYELSTGAKFLMRCRPSGWDRWNGTNWLTLGGVLTGIITDRVYSVIQDDKFILSNGVDRLKMWNGVDATPVADLSADAPIAAYVTRIGTRLLAARIRVGGVLDPDLIAWCADGNIYEWTSALLGAGSAAPFPEGAGRKPNYITGLSTAGRGAVIYRQAAIQLAMLTGQGAAPFRFTTIDFSHGTESPYSISTGGMVAGDFFLGSDYMPYLFDGNNPPIPIGGPIHDELLSQVYALKQVIGAVNTNDQEYWLAHTIAEGTTLAQAWVFDIREFALHQKLVWRKRTPPANLKTFGFGNIPVVADPIVNTVSTIVNTDNTVVDAYGQSQGPDRIMFGDTVGQVSYVDKVNATANGTWSSKQFTHPQGHNLTVDLTRLQYTSIVGGTVLVSVSVDGGMTFSPEKLCALAASGLGPSYCSADHRVTGKSFIVRLRPQTGFIVISGLEVTYQDLGRAHG